MERIAGLICANFETRDLNVLTQDRTIAALPFGGRYRMIDFPLSNMVNSDIQAVGLITPYKYRSIFDHVGAGKEWNLDRKSGGLFILPGSTFGISGSRSRFLMRDLKRNEVFLKRSMADYVVLTAVDMVYNMDYRPMIEAHERSGADVTLLYAEASWDSPEASGLVLDGDRVTAFNYGVKAGENVFCSCFVISRILLLNVLDWYATVEHLDLFEALEADFDKMDVRAYACPSFIRGISTIDEYYRNSMELLKPEVQEALLSLERPVYTKVRDSIPTKYLSGALAKNALVSSGCVIGGTVENSILFRGVTVEAGAVVRNSVVMQDCTIGAGAVVENAILDKGNVVASDMVLKGSEKNVFVLGKKTV